MRRALALTAHVGPDGPRDNAPTPSRHGRAWISTTESRTSHAPAAWGRLRYVWTQLNQYGLIVASQTRRCRLTSQIRLFVGPMQPVKGPVFGEGQRRGPLSSYLFSGIIIIIAFSALATRELLSCERRYAVGRTSGFLRTDTDSCNYEDERHESSGVIGSLGPEILAAAASRACAGDADAQPFSLRSSIYRAANSSLSEAPPLRKYLLSAVFPVVIRGEPVRRPSTACSGGQSSPTLDPCI